MRRQSRTAALCAIAALSACIQSVSAQNWRPDNPDQPNGYHASEAASHYHGDLHLPAQQQNGYHASEFRSHYGGERYEPSSGWHDENNSGPGSTFTNYSNNSNYDNMPGSAFSSGRWYQNGGPENSFSERMQRSARWQEEYRNLRSAGYTPRYGSTGARPSLYGAANNEAGNSPPSAGAYQQQPGYTSFSDRFQTFMPAIERERALRERAINRIEDGGGFNRIYSGQ